MAKKTGQSRNKRGILQRLAKDVVLGAEGYIFELERRGYVKAGAFVPEVVADEPQAVKELHREFLRAGGEVMVALTYYAHRSKLKLVGREGELESMNRQAVRMANEVASEGDALVAGDICNTWAYNPDDKKTFKVVSDMYKEQLAWAMDEGIDLVVAETLEYVGEALLALEAIKQYNLPAMVTFAATYPKSKDGYAWDEACALLEREGADIVGLNCIRGPETMLPLLQKIRRKVKGYVAAQPVPYRTTRTRPAFQFLKNGSERAFPLALEPHLHTRFEMADFALAAKKMGVNYIGICCGGAPHMVRAMAEALGRTVPASRYSPDLSQHGMLGKKQVVQKHEAEFLRQWK